MRIHITGEVMDEITEEENSTKYHIFSEEAEYEVIARGGQAFKDYLFVRKHQQMEIEGILEAKKIFLEKARVRLKEKGRKRETEDKVSGREISIEKINVIEKNEKETNEGERENEGTG